MKIAVVLHITSIIFVVLAGLNLLGVIGGDFWFYLWASSVTTAEAALHPRDRSTKGRGT